ncbi:MAG: nuclear transport factor 2 family protein [Gemmatimonadota bacterium]
MRRAIGFAFLLLLGCATSNPSTETRQDVVAEEAAIRSLDEQERTAVLNRDASALERLWADSFTVNAPSGQVASGKSQVMALLRQGLIHYSTFDRQVEAVRIDGDVAIVMGRRDGPADRRGAAGGADGAAPVHEHLEGGRRDVAPDRAPCQRGSAPLTRRPHARRVSPHPRMAASPRAPSSDSTQRRHHEHGDRSRSPRLPHGDTVSDRARRDGRSGVLREGIRCHRVDALSGSRRKDRTRRDQDR